MTLVKRRAFQQVAGDFSHATALDAGLLLLPLQLRPLIHHTSSRPHRGRPRPRQHANWLRHHCVVLLPISTAAGFSQENSRVRRHGVQPGLSRLLNGPLQLTIHSAISKFLRRLRKAVSIIEGAVIRELLSFQEQTAPRKLFRTWEQQKIEAISARSRTRRRSSIVVPIQ